MNINFHVNRYRTLDNGKNKFTDSERFINEKFSI